MGYYTRFTLSHDGSATTEAITAAFVVGNNYFEFLDDDDAEYLINGDTDETKWYQHDEDLLAVSTLLPDTTFTLSGEGEKQGDVWRKTYRGGKCIKTQKARLVLDDGEKAK